MVRLWCSRDERWSADVSVPASTGILARSGDMPTRGSIAADIARAERKRNRRTRGQGRDMTAPAKCQTLVNTEDGEGEPCGQVATFIVKGRPGNHWYGVHCDPHALDVARHMGHQGGSVIVPIVTRQ